MLFQSQKPQYEYLRNRWISKHRNLNDNLWTKHGEVLKHITVSAVGGFMLLATPLTPLLPSPGFTSSRDDVLKDYDKNVLLAAELKQKLPSEVRSLDKIEEKEILDIISRNFDVNVKAELNGIRLSRSYGLIGGEQHLYRYPGDNLFEHAESSLDWAKYGEAGIAPGLGAWGYFAPSKAEFREIDKMREKYYLAVQTFLVPGYVENVDKYRNFFKYRKMLVINPQGGQAVVADIADAGPSEWTGKHLGGSPEVMDVLGLAQGSRKGPVLYFFIDDPENKIPLGPIKTVKDEVRT